MRFRSGRTLAGLAALAAAACFTAAPAEARDCRERGQCYSAKAHKSKIVRHARQVPTKARLKRADRRRADRRRLARSQPRGRVHRSGRRYLAQRDPATRDPTWFVWHGWAGSYHLDGRRYAGGNPRGPAMALNNWEGGFHPEAFWVLAQRNLP